MTQDSEAAELRRADAAWHEMIDARDAKIIALESRIKELEAANAAQSVRIATLLEDNHCIPELEARIKELEGEVDQLVFSYPKGHGQRSIDALAEFWKVPPDFAKHHVRVDRENDALRVALTEILDAHTGDYDKATSLCGDEKTWLVTGIAKMRAIASRALGRPYGPKSPTEPPKHIPRG